MLHTTLHYVTVDLYLLNLSYFPHKGFPGDSDGEESAWSAGDWGSIPGSGWSPGKRNGNPLQYPCLENSMDGGACRVTVHGVAELNTTERLHFHFFTFFHFTHTCPSGNHIFVLCMRLFSFSFVNSTYKWNHMLCHSDLLHPAKYPVELCMVLGMARF